MLSDGTPKEFVLQSGVLFQAIVRLIRREDWAGRLWTGTGHPLLSGTETRLFKQTLFVG